MGKTSMALDIAAKSIVEGESVLIHSLEMPSYQLIGRLIAKMNRELTIENTLYGKDYEEKKELIDDTILILRSSRFHVEDYEDYSEVTMLEIEKVTNEHIEEFGELNLSILDYIQLMSSNLRTTDENTITGDNSRKIKLLAKKTKAPWVILSQLNRKVDERTDKRPLNSDLRNSGSIEQDADLILFPYRDNVYKEKELKSKIKEKPDNEALQSTLDVLLNCDIEPAEIIIGKNRNGPLRLINVQFHKKSASYINVGDMDQYGDISYEF
jgi:replicative DNA helicase